ncbi:hypothetical protein NDU88_006570 [Pleurodeles waltl]|uniref:Uncharacterized protein n=1 Tax=Pleurodeles waltl TaxID=8319 RepID=A0AAV7VMB5_PLEWA|nr:hypothetical protein NDU88_006570 [Pleurodeles waltl]
MLASYRRTRFPRVPRPSITRRTHCGASSLSTRPCRPHWTRSERPTPSPALGLPSWGDQRPFISRFFPHSASPLDARPRPPHRTRSARRPHHNGASHTRTSATKLELQKALRALAEAQVAGEDIPEKEQEILE